MNPKLANQSTSNDSACDLRQYVCSLHPIFQSTGTSAMTGGQGVGR